MNRTLKITGFSLQTDIKQKLADLFSRVAQVEKVYLSSDRNVAFIRLTCKASVQFVLELQDWELSRERLNVRHAIPQTTSSTSQTSKDTNHEKNIFLAGNIRHSDCVLDNTTSCTSFTREDYTSGRSQFWADVPHQTFPLVGKTKKRKRNSDVSTCTSGPDKKHCRPKRRKKQQKAYLEPVQSIPFGVTPSVKPDCEIDAAHDELQPKQATEYHQQIAKPSHLESDTTPDSKMKQQQDHVVEDDSQQQKPDSPVEQQQLQPPSDHSRQEIIQHEQLQEPYGQNEGLRGHLPQENMQNDQLLSAAQRQHTQRDESSGIDADQIQFCLKGRDTQTVSLRTPVTLADVLESIEEKTGTPKSLLHVTFGGRCLTDDMVPHLQSGVNLHYTVKGKGGMHSGETGQQDTDPAEQKKVQDAVVLKNEGNKMYEKEQYVNAVSYYTASIAVFPLVAAFNNRAQCHLYLSHWEECIRDCNEVLNREPQNLKDAALCILHLLPRILPEGATGNIAQQTLLRRGKALKGKGELEMARADLAVVLKMSKGHLQRTAKESLEWIDNELSKKSAEHCALKAEVKQGLGQGPENSTPPDQLSKSARKRRRKNALKNKESSPLPVGTDGSEKRGPGLAKSRADGTTAEPVSDETATKNEDQLPVLGQLSASPEEVRPIKEAQAANTEPAASLFFDAVERTILPTSSRQDVKFWLERICGLTGEYLKNLEGLNGKTLFAYENNLKKLVEHTGVPVGVARKIIFCRDNPDCLSVMLEWDVKLVRDFVETCVYGQNLSKISEKQIDGAALLSYRNEHEIEQDFGLKPLIAFQIMVERNNFLEKERISKNRIQKIDEKSETGPGEGSNMLPPDKENNERVVENTSERNTTQKIDTGETENTNQEGVTWVSLEKEDPFTVYKLFLQNNLRLQPVVASSRVSELKECDLRVVYHKRKDLNKLEEQFLFFILCRPEFCRGRSAKDAYTKLWKMIKDTVSATWSKLLPDDAWSLFVFEDDSDRIQYEYKTISFGEDPAKISSITEFNKTVRGLEQFSTHVMLIDKQVLEDGCLGYSLKLKVDKTTETFQFGFDSGVPFWFFDSTDFGWGFQREFIAAGEAGALPSYSYTSTEWSKTDDDKVDHVQDHTEITNTKTYENGCANDNLADVHDSGTETCQDVTDEKATVEIESLNTVTKVGSSHSLHDPPKFITPRPFNTKTWKYDIGLLKVIETGDHILFPSVELKYQAGCPPESDNAKRSFVYKSLEFICGCLNARKNGTICFGVAEKPMGDNNFKFGEIVGMEMNQVLCQTYYDLFHNVFLEKCFPYSFETVKMCVAGPVFIPVRNAETKHVIEIDIEPTFSQTKHLLFEFDPRPIFKEYGAPAKHEKDFPGHQKHKHIYLQHQEDWSGIFRRDGSATKYVDLKDKRQFEQQMIPSFASKREEVENQDRLFKFQCVSSTDAEKLKTFVEKVDPSMFPLLVLPKLTDKEKMESIDYFNFLHYIRWSAVFDFDEDSGKDGIYSLTARSNTVFEVLEAVAHDFEDMSVEELKERLLFPRKAAWIFANGKSSGEKCFQRLDREAWKEQYLTYLQTAIHAFYKSKSVIPPTRRLALILVSSEVEDGILELAQEIKTAFGWNNIFFIFQTETERKYFADELGSVNRVLERSVVMPWKHAHYVVCECLNVKGKNRDKTVCTAKGASVPIHFSDWQSWNDLEILALNECQEEWNAMSKSQKKFKAEEEERNFYQGKLVSWWNFFCTDQPGVPDHVMDRSIKERTLKRFHKSIRSAAVNENDRLLIIPVAHMPGAGGTTFCKNILWTLRSEYKCAVIRKVTENTEQQVCHFWEAAEEGVEKHELKPVVLLVDNLTSDSPGLNERDLFGRLHRKQIEYQLPNPLAVVIYCCRNVNPASENELHLSHKLSSDEMAWLEAKHEELEERNLENVVETFIAFLSLRHGFNTDILQKTIDQFISHESLEPNERKLIEFIALITSYFPVSMGSPGLPVTGCDELMRTYRDQFARTLPWERVLSKVAQVLLVIEERDESPRYFVRIANQPYAKVILDTVLRQKEESLGDIVKRCLRSSLVSSSSQARKIVVQILSRMLLDRQVEEGSEQLTHLSPLIDKIKDGNFTEAAEVLLEGYKRLKNEAFYQQLARLYMTPTVSKLDKAKEYAQMAVDLSPDKRRNFKHTLGVVYSKIFMSKKNSVNFNEGNVSKNIENICHAFHALENFTDIQANDDDVLYKCFTNCEIIELVINVLQYLEIVLPQAILPKLGRYVTEEEFSYPLFDQKEEVKDTLKTLLRRGIRSLHILYCVGYSYRVGKNEVRDVRNVRVLSALSKARRDAVRKFPIFAHMLRTIHQGHPSTLNALVGSPNADNAHRLEIVKLGGCFFERIFYDFKSTRSASGKEKKVKALTQIKHHLCFIDELSLADTDNFMTVCLALELLGERMFFTKSDHNFYKMSCQIVQAKDSVDDVCRSRAHLFRIFLTWPKTMKESFNHEQFTSSFHFKSQPLMYEGEALLPKVHFFVTKSDRPLCLCHSTAIYGDDMEEALTETPMSKLLESFTGKYKVFKKQNGEQFSYIEMAWQCPVGVLNLKIWKIRGVKVFREEMVEFYIGFTLHGPVAFIHNIISIENPQAVHEGE